MATQNATDAGILPLPKGGGAARAMDEAFEASLNTGAGSYSIPLMLPKGVDDHQPSLSLSYSSGRGNGIFGLGWDMRLPSIRINPDLRHRGGEPVFQFEGRRLTPVGGGHYRPLAEAEFSTIRRLDAGWEVRTKTGQALRFGTDPSARSGRADSPREWHLEEILDVHGNAITAHWSRHGTRARLDRIAYAIYELRFAHEARPDAFSSFRDGYEMETAERVSAISVYLADPDPRIFKTYRLSYEEAPHSGLSLLSQVELVAQDQPVAGGPVTEEALPPVRLGYVPFDPGTARLELLERGRDMPPDLTRNDVTLLDLDGAGRPGIVQMSGGRLRYWANRPDGWAAPREIDALPPGADLARGNLVFADMAGNGTADLVDADAQVSGYWPLGTDGTFGRKVAWRQSPTTALADPRARLVDLDGDGRIDMLRHDGARAYHHFNGGEAGWDPVPSVTARGDFPPVDLASPRTRFADMAGDGRSHLVTIHDRRVTWYPNLGQGRWGTARRMANAPALPRNYDPARLFLADIDGSGMADVIYVGQDRVTIWINRSGRAFSDPLEIAGTPPMASAAVMLADMRGRGTRGVLWSYPAARRGGGALRYLDPCGGAKPYLLSSITNNRQVETRITWGSSTDWERDRDDPDIEQAGFLPFPVPVVARIEVTDPARGLTAASSFEYRNGHFDGENRSFMGFGRGTRRDLGDETIPTRKVESYFHTRDPALKGVGFLTRTYGEDAGPEAHRPYEEEVSEVVAHPLAAGLDGRQISHVRRLRRSTRRFERGARAHERELEEAYDAFGNVIESRETARWDEDGAPRENVTVTSRAYTSDPAGILTGFLAREVVRDGAGSVLSARVLHYDGPDFEGLPEGGVTAGALTRETKLAILPAQDIFGLPPAEMAAHGYAWRNDADIGPGWWIDTTRHRRDARGAIVERLNPRGTSIGLDYDAHGLHPIRVSLPNGAELRAQYDYRYGGISRYLDMTGVARDFTYDIAGRLVATSRFDDAPGQPFMEYRYDETAIPNSTMTLIRSEPGGPQHRRVEYFDGTGERLQTRAEAADGEVVVSGRVMLNVRGLKIAEMEPHFSTGLAYRTDDQTAPDKAVRITYDAEGRAIRRTDPEGAEFRTEYSLGLAVHSDPFDLDPAHAQADTPTHVRTDALGRVIRVEEMHEGGSHVTHYGWDALGRRATVDVAGSRHTTNDHDCLGRRYRSVYRDAGTWTWFHDASGNLVERVDGAGKRVHRTWDALDRMTALRHGGASGSLEEAYAYDAGQPGETHTMGKLTEVTGPFGALRYRYGPCGCIEAKTRIFPGLAEPQTVTYVTDSLDRQVSVIYPDGRAQDFVYDAGGLLRGIPGVVNRIDYTPSGRKRRVEHASGVVSEYDYAPGSGRLTRARTIAPFGAVTYADAGYAYDALGSVSAISDAATRPGHVPAPRSFVQDGLSRLLRESGVDGNGGYVHDYVHDAAGNLADVPEGAGALGHADAALPHRITDAGYAYDAAGNLTATPEARLDYDDRNRLVRIEHINGTVVTHLYDPQGVRVVTRVTVGAVTDTELNFDDIWFLNGMTPTRVIFDPEGPVALIRGNGTGACFHRDHLGSHTLATDLASGEFLGETVHYAYGRIARQTGAVPGPFRYNGKKYSEVTPLLYYGARYYAPELGRFITPDPLYLDSQERRFFDQPRALLPYTYVLDNPMNMVDPKGTFAFLIGLAIAAAVGFGVGVAAYSINQAYAGGDWQLSEALMSGLMGAVSIGAAFAIGGPGLALVVGTAKLLAPAITGALDQAAMGNDAGSRFLGFLSFMIKWAAAPVTTTLSFIFGMFGTGLGLWGSVSWFRGGVIAFEYDRGGPFSATTFGGTVQIWHGNAGDPLFAHEIYHSRQYSYFGDSFVPYWLLGGVYGLISSAAAGNFQWSCFSSGNPNSGYGNPLEDGAHAAARGGGCT